ncbi:MAG: PH domain-containing protein [Humibacillus sp.]|nr:PH domain-containing protein [Humibacillus sp.]MDN5779579.1 PH domain-containing protein [Humibacillus sp.]
MGFPENVLARGERVERSIHPHWLTVALPTVMGVLLVAVVVAVTVVTPDDSTGNGIQLGAVVILLVLAVWLVVVPFLRWRTTHYVVTSHRVMVRRGIISKSGKDITLSKITDVSFRQTLFDRIINAGSLHVESAGDSPDEDFANIPNSNDVQQLINRLIDEDDLRRRRNQGALEGSRDDVDDRDDESFGGTRDPNARRDRPELAEERRHRSRRGSGEA